MLFSAIIFGLISSLHCIGMCGPIAMMLPVSHHNPQKKGIQIAVYHLGRLFSYATLGLVFGLVGKGLSLAGAQQYVSIMVGIGMIVIALVPEKLLAQYNFSRPIHQLLSAIKAKLGQQFKKKSTDALFAIGILNGFLPCGMVYAALFGALAMPRYWDSVLYMLLFGLGTIPLMTAVVYVSNLLSFPIRTKVQKVIPLVICLIGVLFILRGLGLGIPYVSPSDMNLFIQSNPECR